MFCLRGTILVRGRDFGQFDTHNRTQAPAQDGVCAPPSRPAGGRHPPVRTDYEVPRLAS